MDQRVEDLSGRVRGMVAMKPSGVRWMSGVPRGGVASGEMERSLREEAQRLWRAKWSFWA
jgi:hypothetical protein